VPQFPCLRHYLPVLNPSHSSVYLLLSLFFSTLNLGARTAFPLLFVLEQDKAVVLTQYYRLVFWVLYCREYTLPSANRRLQQPFPPIQFLDPLCCGNNRREPSPHRGVQYPLFLTDIPLRRSHSLTLLSTKGVQEIVARSVTSLVHGSVGLKISSRIIGTRFSLHSSAVFVFFV
jgi:hypothetical protein